MFDGFAQCQIGRLRAPARIWLLCSMLNWPFARARSYLVSLFIVKLAVCTRPLVLDCFNYTTLYYTIHYTIPHYTIPHYTIPHYTIPLYTTPHYTIPHYTTPHYTIPHYTTPHYTTHYTWFLDWFSLHSSDFRRGTHSLAGELPAWPGN